jgi:L-aspartate oxidase
METERARFLAIGSGLAGLAFALHAAKHGKVIVLTKAQVSEANTAYAQGGIAAAVGSEDSWKLHEEDTLIAGAGLCDVEAVRFLVQRAPDAVKWLASLGARFDLESDGDFALGREGGHSRHRILHYADTTGWEIERALISAVAEEPNITVVEHAFVTRLLVQEGRCVGASAVIEGLGERHFLADATMLATGGAGRMYRHTTNPSVATADGIALALDAGLAVDKMEFMQFHPTTLYHPQLRSFLITEATRGAGATLRNHLGRRFMYDYDERLELAPRDVVARAMTAEMKRLDTWCLYLDLTHLPPNQIRHEFPNIYEKLLSIGLDITRDWIPVVPAQHYSCGGVVTDLSARTALPGLFAAGEVACTGVHGANRLASNSLLEAVVFAIAAADVATSSSAVPSEAGGFGLPRCVPESDAVRIRKKLQTTMTDLVGIVRTNDGLKLAKKTVDGLVREWNKAPEAPFSQYARETYHLLQAATTVIDGAIRRPENVGLHFNSDLGEALPESNAPREAVWTPTTSGS